MFDALVRDIRFAFRALKRDAVVALFAIAITGIGIGASTTVFSLVRALLLRPLPFAAPERLVWISNGGSENLSDQTAQVSNLEELRAQTRAFEGIAGFFPFYGPGDARLSGGGEPERLTRVPVTQDFFPLLGIVPMVGRSFDEAESRYSAEKTAVLDYRFWRRRFNGDIGIVGKTIVLDGKATTVLGILPESFDFTSTFTPGKPADLFVPFPLSPETNRQGNTLALIGRLRPGATLEQARAESHVVGERIKALRALPDARRNGFTPVVVPLRDRVSGRFSPALLALSGAVAFLMLLVCANLSNLLLVRASVRQREMALRAALGAVRRRLVAQLLVESLVLCVGGGVLGLVLAAGGTALVSRLQATTIPLLADVRVDGFVLGFSMVVAIATGLAFGLLPALQASGHSPASVLADGSRGSSARAGWMRRAIVVTEVALVCVLLTGAGLLARSLGRVLSVQPGYTTENLVAVRVDPERAGTTVASRTAWFSNVLREVRAVPGVEAVGLTDALPLGDNFGWRRWGVQPVDRPDLRGVEPLVRMVDEGYLGALQIPVRQGRGFTAADDEGSERVVIINDVLANTLWPGQDPIGRSLITQRDPIRVIGVVGAVRYFAIDRAADAEMYFPIRQTGDYLSVDLVVRSTMAPSAVMASVRQALHRLDPNQPVVGFRTMQQLVDQSTFARRFVVMLVAGFAGFGLLLAGLGLYAVVSYSVAQRTHEIGIRMALGATASGVGRSIFGQTAWLIGAGLAIGAPVAWMAARGIRGLLFDIGTTDPVTVVVVLLVLSVVAAMAGYLPARRATRIDPGVALRQR